MDYPSDKDIIRLLSNDPIKNAENMTGKDSSDDVPTMKLGFMMNVYDGMVKKKALKAIGDTVFSMDWLAYCELIETFGFGLMMEDFAPDGGASIRIYYHEKDGLLLSTDSYHGNRSSASVYYNWKPNRVLKPQEEWKNPNVEEWVPWYDVTSSGGFYYPNHERYEIPDELSDPGWDDIVWSGDHDAREALRFNLKRLREKGTFIPKWKEQPYMRLLGHWEKDDKDKYKTIREGRLNRLPQWVQDNIRGEK